MGYGVWGIRGKGGGVGYGGGVRILRPLWIFIKRTGDRGQGTGGGRENGLVKFVQRYTPHLPLFSLSIRTLSRSAFLYIFTGCEGGAATAEELVEEPPPRNPPFTSDFVGPGSFSRSKAAFLTSTDKAEVEEKFLRLKPEARMGNIANKLELEKRSNTSAV